MSRAMLPATIVAAPKACAHCPWRLVNQGKRTADSFYSKRNLARLWAGLRRGELMSCHPTDERMNEYESAPPVKPGTEMHTCTGALVLIERELWHAQECVNAATAAGAKDGAARYRRRRPRGLTQRGILGHLERLLFGMPRPNLNDPDVGYPPLGKWKAVK